jgi:hypothetical protein
VYANWRQHYYSVEKRKDQLIEENKQIKEMVGNKLD